MKRRLTPGEKAAFAAMLLVTTALLVLTPFFVPLTNLLDSLLFFAAIGALYLIARARKLPLFVYWLIFFVFLADGLGVLGLFAASPLGLGYDKYIHFTTGFCFTLFLVAWLQIKDKRLRFLVALLCLMGFAALGEIVEFSGSQLFHLNRGGLIAMGDGQAPTGSPLQVYDTQFDLLFNLGGSIVGLLLAFFLGKRMSTNEKGM